MTIADATDTALIAELRAKLEQAGDEVVAWQTRAQKAIGLCEHAQAELAELRQATAGDAQRITALEREIEELRCGDLVAFGDGELEPERAERFRRHLKRCANCQGNLVGHIGLAAQLSEGRST